MGPATAIFIGMFLPETSNNLIKHGHIEEVLCVLEKVRGMQKVDTQLLIKVDTLWSPSTIFVAASSSSRRSPLPLHRGWHSDDLVHG
jgi:hypothetical protein